MTSTPEHDERWSPEDFVSTEELARRQGVKPITSIAELAQPDLWESDEEYDAFLEDLYASRRAGLACLASTGHSAMRVSQQVVETFTRRPPV